MLCRAPLEVARTKAWTSAPEPTRASVKWEPMNPSAPVTKQVVPRTSPSRSVSSSIIPVPPRPASLARDCAVLFPSDGEANRAHEQTDPGDLVLIRAPRGTRRDRLRHDEALPGAGGHPPAERRPQLDPSPPPAGCDPVRRRGRGRGDLPGARTAPRSRRGSYGGGHTPHSGPVREGPPPGEDRHTLLRQRRHRFHRR